MDDDVLGGNRFDRVDHWRARGRVEGDVDDVELRTFTIERNESRWLLTSEDQLRVVGDAHRDLVATDGQLRRQPPKQGFLPYLSAHLLRQIHVFDRADLSSWRHVGAGRETSQADRPATMIDLTDQTYAVTLGIDAESGVWTYVKTRSFSVVVDELTLGTPPSELFGLLDMVPGIDLSSRATVTGGLDAAREQVARVSGLTVEALSHDDQTGEFRLVLVDGHGAPQGLITRRHDSAQPDPVFGGIQHRTEGEDWVQHIDTTSQDPAWVFGIARALEGV